MLAGLNFGGQLMITTDVENYPGYPDGVTGPVMMEEFQKQAERFGTEILIPGRDPSVDFSEAALCKVATDREAVHRRRGRRSRPVPPHDGSDCDSEEATREQGRVRVRDLRRRALPRQADGGGGRRRHGDGRGALPDPLRDEGHVVHRRGELRASKIMQERALENEKIEFAWHSVVDEVLGDEFVTGVRLKDIRDESTREIDLEALFIAIGHQPNTSLFAGQLEMDDSDYLKS